MSTAPRGLRNFNPGNIDYNPRNKWQGQLGIEQGVPNPRFARFDSHLNGIRAMTILLKNYRDKKGLPGIGSNGIDTVREVINRWAPGFENDTEAYIQSVARRVGVTPDAVIDLKDPVTVFKLVKGMIRHEQGLDPYTDEDLRKGVAMAFA